MSLDNTDRGKILVWGNFGKEIKNLDEKRLYAITQDNPDYYLNILLSDELEEIFDIMINCIEHDKNIDDELMEKIFKSNELHNLFKEMNKFLTHSDDMLSIGSFLTGEFDKSDKLAQILDRN